MKRIFFMMLCLTICSELHSQEFHYIRDVLYVPLRSGQTLQHRIVHKGLVSGTKLTILETSEDNSYSKVRTEKGTEGWVQSQYLSPEPAGRDLYKLAQVSIAKLKKQNSELTQQLAVLQSQDKKAQQDINQLSSKSTQMSKELAHIKEVSANALKLEEDNKTLLNENQRLKNQFDVLSADNKRLQDDKENDAFLNGAFAVLIGVMITLIVPMFRSRKDSSWA